jgi:hypothetical protein
MLNWYLELCAGWWCSKMNLGYLSTYTTCFKKYACSIPWILFMETTCPVNKIVRMCLLFCFSFSWHHYDQVSSYAAMFTYTILKRMNFSPLQTRDLDLCWKHKTLWFVYHLLPASTEFWLLDQYPEGNPFGFSLPPLNITVLWGSEFPLISIFLMWLKKLIVEVKFSPHFSWSTKVWSWERKSVPTHVPYFMESQ